AVHLAAVGVAFHCNVDESKRSLRRIIHFSREQNSTRAGAEDWLAQTRELGDRPSKRLVFDKLQHRGCLAARNDQSIQRAEGLCRSNFYRSCTRARDRTSMCREVTLDCQHSDSHCRLLIL